MEEIIDTKRSSVEGREGALVIYIDILMRFYAQEEIESRCDQLYLAFLKSISSPSEKEASLALRAIALTLITNPSETAYDGLYKRLQNTYTESEFPTVKAAAIHTMSAAAIYGGAGDDEIEQIMDDLLAIVESDGASIDADDNGEVVAAATEAWGYLLTYVDDMEDKTEVAMEAFVEQLESRDTSVQITAGTNIALLFEKSFTSREEDDEPATEAESYDDEGHPLDVSFVKRYDAYRQKSQLEYTLTQLSKESSKKVAKKDRKSLHKHFADVLNTVEHPPRGPAYSKAIDQETNRRYGSRMVVRVNKTGSMTIDKWWKLQRLQALKRVLGGGFVKHYTENEVVFESLPIMISKS